jgi:hypothetical protein
VNSNSSRDLIAPSEAIGSADQSIFAGAVNPQAYCRFLQLAATSAEELREFSDERALFARVERWRVSRCTRAIHHAKFSCPIDPPRQPEHPADLVRS